ncbi:hypothetical protein COM24_14980 [Bacillus toyonensis]|uniref:spore germination protein n=1 Tax=Bacillus toyonensis TaxID=155322 RepID=UPI000BF5C2E4|nr:spore germination protein [Bacillus toyonensis]PGC53279.1 hypothetical protein COM24_14980 [Bacillus toyonensis]
MRFFNKSLLQNNPVKNKKALTSDLKENIEKIKEYLCRTEDLMIKEINIKNQKFSFLYLEPLVKKELILSLIIEPMLEENKG